MNRTFPMLAGMLAASVLAFEAGAQDSDARTLATQVCASCHGPGGRSISSAFPRLAGQQPAYLEAQLKAFRDRSRADPMAQAYMWGMSSRLDDATIKGLADYYAMQTPGRDAKVDPKLAREGGEIFANGIPAAGVPACVTCHGKAAEGNASFPRLAGQHADYLVKQLALFKSELRAGSNAPVMHNVSHGMTFDQMTAVSAFLDGK